MLNIVASTLSHRTLATVTSIVTSANETAIHLAAAETAPADDYVVLSFLFYNLRFYNFGGSIIKILRFYYDAWPSFTSLL